MRFIGDLAAILKGGGKMGIRSCIDVGTSKICSILANVPEGGVIQILGVGIAPSQGLHKGIVVDVEEAKRSIRESLERAGKAGRIGIKSAYVSVTGKHISSFNNRAMVPIAKERLVTDAEFKQVLNIANTTSMTRGRDLLHVIPRQYILDGQVGVKNPLGRHGFRLDTEAHVISAEAGPVRTLRRCIQEVGVKVEDLVVNSLASGEAVLEADEKEAGVIVADIGAGTTDIAVFKDGNIWHTAILPVGGYQLTNDIAIGLDVPFNVAEQMKLEYGDVTPGMDERARAELVGAEGKGAVFYKDIRNILTARMTETFELILQEIPIADCAKMLPAGLVLTGGTANLPGMVDLGREVLGMPVRIGEPKVMYGSGDIYIYGIGDILCEPTYATSVGLLLWETRYDVKKRRGELVLGKEGVSTAWEATRKERVEGVGWRARLRRFGRQVRGFFGRLRLPITISRAPR